MSYENFFGLRCNKSAPNFFDIFKYLLESEETITFLILIFPEIMSEVYWFTLKLNNILLMIVLDPDLAGIKTSKLSLFIIFSTLLN